MRLLLLTALAVITSFTLTAQIPFDATHVEGYIINHKGQRTEGVLLLEGSYAEQSYYLQNRVGFMERKKWDKLKMGKKVKDKEFEMLKGKDIAEYGFGDVKYRTSKFVAIDGALDPLAMSKKMFYEVYHEAGPITVFRVWPSIKKGLHGSGTVMADAAILFEGMKGPKKWDQIKYVEVLGACPTIVSAIEAGDYAPISAKTGKIGIGGAINQAMMNDADEKGMPKGLRSAMKLIDDYQEQCGTK